MKIHFSLTLLLPDVHHDTPHLGLIDARPEKMLANIDFRQKTLKVLLKFNLFLYLAFNQKVSNSNLVNLSNTLIELSKK